MWFILSPSVHKLSALFFVLFLANFLYLLDLDKSECTAKWRPHERAVCNIQFSCNEKLVYSMGADGKFCSRLITNKKDYFETTFSGGSWVEKDESDACVPTPRGKLFAFLSDDMYVLTCSSHEAIFMKVSSKQ